MDRELEDLYSGSESELGSEVDYREQLHESEDDGWDLSEGSGSDCEPPPFVLEAGEAGPSDFGGLVWSLCTTLWTCAEAVPCMKRPLVFHVRGMMHGTRLLMLLVCIRYYVASGF